MRRIPNLARVGRLLAVVLTIAPWGGAPRPIEAQEPGRDVDPKIEQLLAERNAKLFARQSRQKIASARKAWGEGRHEDAIQELEQGLEEARKTLGERPNAPSVDLIKTMARVHESKGAFGAAAEDLRRALDIQARLTGPQSWEVTELRGEIGRLGRLAKLGADRLEALSRLGPTTALVSTGHGAIASAVCIDPRGLFLTRARPLANLWRSRTTHFEYSPGGGGLIGMRTDYNYDEPMGLLIVLNPGRPDQVVLPARLVRTGATEDLALLATPAGRPLAALELARGDEPEVGAEAIALNHWNAPVRGPLDQPEPIWLRACPAHIASVRSSNGRPWIYLLDAPPTPGGSEGPVLDGRGRLLGLAVQGLPGTGISYTIPAHAIREFLGKAAVLAGPPTLSYRARKREHEWTIPIWVADPQAPEVAVEVAFGEGRSRPSFRATGLAERPDTFAVRVVPVDPKTVDRVDLLVGNGSATTRVTVEDREVTVGPTKIRLSELRRLELGPEPRGIAADGRVLAGAPGGLDGLTGQVGDTIAPVDLQGASIVDVVYPPESAGPVRGELVVRSRGEVLLRERLSVRYREPLVDLGGVLDVSRAPAPSDRREDPAPSRPEEERALAPEGKIAAVAVGGGGRYLLLTLPGRKELVVFDAFRRRIATRVTLVADDALVAGGVDAFFIVYPGPRIIHRWDLRTMALDRTAALPIRGEAKAVALGADSSGPMLVRWVENQDGGKFTQMDFSFIDPESLKVLACETFRERSDPGGEYQRGAMPEPGVFRMQRYSTGNDLVNLRASPRGDVFGLWQSGVSPAGYCTLALRGREIRAFERHSDSGHLLPGQDGRTVFTGNGERLDLEGQPRDGGGQPTAQPGKPSNSPPPKPARLIPSAEPAYYLAIDGLGPGTGPPSAESRVVVSFRALGLDRPLGTVEVPWPASNPGAAPQPGAQPPRRPDDDQRFHWVPAADLLVVIPPGDDRLLLRRVGLDELLRKLKEDDLFVGSPRGMDVVLGQPFRRAIAAKTGRGRVEFALAKGPGGMSLSPEGVLAWDQPAGEPGHEVEVVVEARDGSGRAVTETIVLRLLASGRATR
jgi:hypothetical protein